MIRASDVYENKIYGFLSIKMAFRRMNSGSRRSGESSHSQAKCYEITDFVRY